MAAVGGASRRTVGDGWKWSRKDSTVDVSPLVAATYAHWMWLGRAVAYDIWIRRGETGGWMLDWVTTLLEGLAALCAAWRVPSSSPGLSADRWVPGWPAGRRAGARCRVRRALAADARRRTPTQRAGRPVSLFRRTQPDFLDPFVVPPTRRSRASIDSTMGRFAPRDRSMRVSAVWACACGCAPTSYRRCPWTCTAGWTGVRWRCRSRRCWCTRRRCTRCSTNGCTPRRSTWTGTATRSAGSSRATVRGARRRSSLRMRRSGRCAWTGRPAGSSTGTWVAWSTTPTCGTSGSSSSPGFPWVCRRSAPRR